MRSLTRFARATRRLCLAVLLVAVVTIGLGCVTAPTGRKQFIVISEEAEIALGVEAYRQALEGAKISTNAALRDRVARVGYRLVEASGRSDLDWQFEVIEDDATINAWALPGGKVAVYTGILKLTEGDDALLATVMGHEIAHVTIRHGAERITTQLGINIVAAGLQAALAERDPETVTLVMSAFGVGTKVAGQLPFERYQESEADREGLRYMARAGYHPGKAIEFWKKMSELSTGDSPPEFLSTHPSYQTRIENLTEWQGEALGEYRPIGN